MVSLRGVFSANHRSIRFLQLSSGVVILFNYQRLSPTGVLASLFYSFIIFHLGITIGAHRYFSHHQFKLSRFWELILVLCHNLTLSGSLLGFVSVHAAHHKHSDSDKDPHNPIEIGRLRAVLGFFKKSNLQFKKRLFMSLYQKKLYQSFFKYYWVVPTLIALICLLVAPIYFVYLICIPCLVSLLMNGVLIAFTHKKALAGDRNGIAINNYWLKPILLGEEMHLNHHTRPNQCNYNLDQELKGFDLLYIFICLIRAK